MEKKTSVIGTQKRKYVIKDMESYSKIRSKNATGRHKVEFYKPRDTVNKPMKFPVSMTEKLQKMAEANETSFNRCVVDFVEAELFHPTKLKMLPRNYSDEKKIQKTITFKKVIAEKLLEMADSYGEPVSRLVVSILTKNLK